MTDKFDSIIEKRIKDKIKKECIDLSTKKNEHNNIMKILSKKYDKIKIKECLEELNIKPIIEKKEIELNKNNIKEKTTKNELKIKYNFKINEHPRLIIIIIMFIIFISGIVFLFLNQNQKFNGSCPYISIDDLRKTSSIFFEKRATFSYFEYNEIIGSYFGKTDCIIINKDTITKIRET
jgi:ATP-dependent Zn protease